MAKITETSEAFDEIKKFVEENFKNFDYHIIISIAKIDETKNINAVGFTLTSITGTTPFGAVKSILANTISQFQGLMNIYNVEPAKPFAEKKQGD